MFVQAGLQMISDMSIRIYSKASIAENRMLAVRFSSLPTKSCSTRKTFTIKKLIKTQRENKLQSERFFVTSSI